LIPDSEHLETCSALWTLRRQWKFDDLAFFEEDGLHPDGAGMHVYADMLIYYFQSMAKRVRKNS
jgi:hypothetical protein